MSRLLCLFLLSFLALIPLEAAPHFVRPGAAGSGSSWADAWGELNTINWASLAAGDTVCIAGGSYAGTITTTASGTNGNPIVLKRATASDTTCGSASTGWNASYDSQIVMSGTIVIASSYLTIDGMTWNGISITMQNPGGGGYSGVATDTATTNITLRNLEVAGPCANGANCLQANDHRSIAIEHWTGTDWAAEANWLVQYNNLHGACNNMVIYGATNLVVEHSRFADSGTTDSTNCHPNIVNGGADSNVIWRFNEMVNWQVEGIMLLGGNSTWDIYSNLWHDPQTVSFPRVLETQNGANGPVHFYNNTIVNLTYITSAASNGGSWTAGTAGRNNIYWNVNQTPSGLGDDYDYSDRSLVGESNGQGSASNPFVDLARHDYRLTAHTNPGLSLGSPFDIDYAGVSRSGAGGWDRGAYEFQSLALNSYSPTAGFVQGRNCQAPTSGQTLGCAFSSAVTAGHLLVAIARWDDSDSSGGPYTAAFSSIAGAACSWTPALAKVRGGIDSSHYNQGLQAAYCVVPSTGSQTVQVSLNASSSPYRDMAILEYSGLQATASMDVTTSGVAAGTTSAVCTSGSTGTLAQSGELAVGFCTAWDNLQTWNALTGWSQRATASSNVFGVYDAIAQNTSYALFSDTLTAADEWISGLITFRSASVVASPKTLRAIVY